jgi:hypothetical protein
MAVPALASADPVGDLLNNLGLSGMSGQSGGSGGGGGSTGGGTRAGTPPTYVPPLHGTNPHGQGDAATVSLAPADANPSTANPALPETLIVGRSKGEQNADGTYHGHINIASLGGNELLSVNTTPGQTAHGPLDPLQTQLLDAICTGSGGQLCLTLLTADSTTTGSGSTNNFSVATAQIGPAASPLSASALTSSGNISNDSTCQTATGTSSVADANVFNAITAGAAHSNSESKACNNGTPSTVTQDSQVIELQGAGTPIPAQGCENGTPNTNFTPLNPLIATVCNANDTNAGQTSAPYGVREALTVFALVAAVPTVKATTAGAETHAVAPTGSTVIPPTTCPPTCPPNNKKNGNGNKNDNGNGNGNGNGSGTGAGNGAGANAGAGNGTLAFTGADLIWLAMLGLGLVGAGLAVLAAMPAARRPRLEA